MAPPQTLLFALLTVTCALMGCQQEQQLPPGLKITPSHTMNKDTRIVIPPDVAGKWKAVRIAVIDKSNVSQKLYTIPIGGKVAIPSSALVIEAETFLPAFTMEGSTITTSSSELKNPGVKVRITENGSEIFRGWLFSMFPKTHAFMHPKYGFTLVDVVPARKQ